MKVATAKRASIKDFVNVEAGKGQNFLKFAGGYK